MKQIANLSYDKFKTKGEVKDGLPLYEKDLLAYYPLEGDTYNIVPEVKIYVKDNALVKEGIKAANAVTIAGATYENNMIKLNGTSSSYIAINKDIFNSHKNYRIDIEYISTKSDKDECLLFIGDKTSVNEFYNIWNNGATQTLSIRRMSRDEKVSTDICKPGDSVPGKLNKVSIYSRNNSLFTSYINGNFTNVHLNSKEKKPTVVYPITNDNYFNGYIKSITINTYDDLHTGTNKVEVYDCGFMGGYSRTNVCTGSTVYNVGWSLGKNLFFEKTENTIYDMPIYRIRIIPDTQELLDRIKNSWSVGIVGSAITVNPNQDACSYLLYRPLTFVNSTRVNGQPTNTIRWTNGKEVDLKNGWRLAYKYRNLGNKQEQETDGLHWTFFSNEMQIGDELIIECSPVMAIKDSQVPASLSMKINETKPENRIIADPKLINDNIDEFSLSYEWIFATHDTDIDYPNHLWLSGYPGSTPATDWVGLYYNGRGWGNCDRCITEFTCKETSIRDASSAVGNFKQYLGHNLKVILSYSKAQKTVRGMLYNKTTKTVLNTFERGNIVFTDFNKLFINDYTNDLIKNFAIFKKSFSIEEMKSICRKDFKITEDGSFYVDYLNEFDFIPYKDSYFLPLDDSSKSICGRLDSVENNPNLFNKKTMVDGFVFDNGNIIAPINADFTSDFMPVNENTNYIFHIINCTKENTPAVAWYDKNKTLIKRDIQNFVGNCDATFTSPAEAMYARLTSRWKNEVTVTFKEKNANKATYAYEDGGLNVGKIKCKAHINLTPNYRGSLIEREVSWDKNLHSDAIDYPGWSAGGNSGVDNPTIGYHAKWVNEGPTRNSCMKFINYNSVFGMRNRWLGISRDIREFCVSSNLAVGDKIQIHFKAKSLNGGNITTGIYRTAISTGKPAFPIWGMNNTTDQWKNYCVEVPVDSDWKLDGNTAIYFYGYEGAEDIVWVSNVHITINGPSYATPDMLEGNQELDLSYNLTDDIDMDWRKPWHISFWRKGISKAAASDFSLWSLGVLDNRNINKGYIYSGMAQPDNFTICINQREGFYLVDNNKYFDQWGYVTVDYDGSNITVRHRGEKFYTEALISSTTISLKDFYKHPDQKSDLFLGSYRGLLNNASIKDLLIIKNKSLTKAEEDKIFHNLMRYDYTLRNRINIEEE